MMFKAANIIKRLIHEMMPHNQPTDPTILLVRNRPCTWNYWKLVANLFDDRMMGVTGHDRVRIGMAHRREQRRRRRSCPALGRHSRWQQRISLVRLKIFILLTKEKPKHDHRRYYLHNNHNYHFTAQQFWDVWMLVRSAWSSEKNRKLHTLKRTPPVAC